MIKNLQSNFYYSVWLQNETLRELRKVVVFKRTTIETQIRASTAIYRHIFRLITLQHTGRKPKSWKTREDNVEENLFQQKRYNPHTAAPAPALRLLGPHITREKNCRQPETSQSSLSTLPVENQNKPLVYWVITWGSYLYLKGMQVKLHTKTNCC